MTTANTTEPTALLMPSTLEDRRQAEARRRGGQPEGQREGDVGQCLPPPAGLQEADALVGEGRERGEGAAEACPDHDAWRPAEPVMERQTRDEPEHEGPTHVDGQDPPRQYGVA